MITAAVSGMLLARDRNHLRCFCVHSLLTGEAREVIYKLPNLHELLVVIEGGTSLPSVVLPNLADLTIKYDRDCGWLEGFRGVTLRKVTSIAFHPGVKSIGDFLGAFEALRSLHQFRRHFHHSGFTPHTRGHWGQGGSYPAGKLRVC